MHIARILWGKGFRNVTLLSVVFILKHRYANKNHDELQTHGDDLGT